MLISKTLLLLFVCAKFTHPAQTLGVAVRMLNIRLAMLSLYVTYNFVSRHHHIKVQQPLVRGPRLGHCPKIMGRQTTNKQPANKTGIKAKDS